MSGEIREIIKKYANDELEVSWKPATCVHSKQCWKELIQVFNPQNRPWINMEGATTERIKKQVDACPSGAISYKHKTQSKNKIMGSKIKINAMENGPLLVEGILEVTRPDGSLDNKEHTTAFCRCGASTNKPYCDGKHKKIDFKG